MAVWHQTYALNNVTPVALRVHGDDRRRGSTVIVQHSGHNASHAVLLGAANMNPATDSYGHRLNGGESIVLRGNYLPEDALYAMSTETTGEVHVLIVGA